MFGPPLSPTWTISAPSGVMNAKSRRRKGPRVLVVMYIIYVTLAKYWHEKLVMFGWGYAQTLTWLRSGKQHKKYNLPGESRQTPSSTPLWTFCSLNERCAMSSVSSRLKRMPKASRCSYIETLCVFVLVAREQTRYNTTCFEPQQTSLVTRGHVRMLSVASIFSLCCLLACNCQRLTKCLRLWNVQ